MKINRRQLIVGAAVGLTAQNERIRIAFLGGSHSHALEKAKALQQLPTFDFVGVHEPNAKVLAKYQALGLAGLTKEQILGDSSIRVVAVESDVANHAADALAALRAGKHVHVEKPPSVTMAEFEQLFDAAQEKKLLVQSGYMWRYNPGIVKALEAAQQGWLGDIFLVRASMNNLLAVNRRAEWGQFKGGQMFEQGSHLVDIVVRLLGKPRQVTPFLRKHTDHPDQHQDNTLAVFEYPKAFAILQAAALQPNAASYRTLEILGSNGTLTLRSIDNPALEIDLAKAAGPFKAGRQNVELAPYVRYRDDFVELANAIQQNRALNISLEQERDIQQTLLMACEMHGTR
jgi:predicted dehydrogenase